jgi:predicted phosphoadenosine phosphosulfate sulfurtransferase
LDRLKKSWSEKGYGRNPRVIKQMLDEGIELENTKQISKLCKKPDIYEIVKIKGDIPDETKIKRNFRIVPSWKSVCITILKNDWGLTYMSVSRPTEKRKLKDAGLDKYTKLKAI